MNAVLTLIATPGLPPLTPAVIATARAALEGQGAKIGAPVWLAEGVAIDLPFSGGADVRPVEAALAGSQVDAVMQPLENRRRKMLLADMDATITEQESLDELADFAGLKPEIAAITEAAMRGELDFPAALRARVALLEGLPETALHDTLTRLTLTPGAVVLVGTLQKNGAPCHLVSGGFRFFTERIARQVGFISERGNQLVIEDGHLTGAVHEPILGREAKLETLFELAAAQGITLPETMAVGDGANDLPMLQAAGLGVAFRAKPKVAAAAQARITHSDLTALLYVQGYRQTDF